MTSQDTRGYSAITSLIARKRGTEEEFLMLEIVWRNPNRLVQEKVTVDRTVCRDPETGEAETIYYRRAATAGEDVEYRLVVNWRQPVNAA
jgi:hypothetical protein